MSHKCSNCGDDIGTIIVHNIEVIEGKKKYGCPGTKYFCSIPCLNTFIMLMADDNYD